MELNDIIKELLDWIHREKISIRKMAFYSEMGGIYVRISFGKNVNGKALAIDHIFYLGGVLCGQSWDNFNNLELDHVIGELKLKAQCMEAKNEN